MRRSVLAAIFVGTLAMLAPPPATARANVRVSISFFHQDLAPYGRWVTTSRFGEVWVPGGIAAGWEPYWDGEWIWTDYGWTWVSNDPWGDIPCHYGTWAWADSYGWVWEPGTVWAPAWVTWAWTDDEIGWAPVPATFVIGSRGYFGAPVVSPASRYVFVPASRFVGTNVRTVRLAPTRNAAILSSARKATRFDVAGGIVRATADPPRSFVQRVSGKRIERASITRLRTRPTTLSQARVSGRRIRVAAPAGERAAIAKSSRSRVGEARLRRQPSDRRASIRSRTNARTQPSTRTSTARVSARRDHARDAARRVQPRKPETAGARTSAIARRATSRTTSRRTSTREIGRESAIRNTRSGARVRNNFETSAHTVNTRVNTHPTRSDDRVQRTVGSSQGPQPEVRREPLPRSAVASTPRSHPEPPSARPRQHVPPASAEKEKEHQ